MIETRANPISIGSVFGLLAGALCIAFTMALHSIDPEFIFSLWVLLGYVIIIALQIISVQYVKYKNKNEIDFKNALRSAFMVSVFGLLIWIVFNAVLFAYIDTELIAMSKSRSIETTKFMMSKGEASEEATTKAIEEAENRDYSPQFSELSFSYAYKLIIGFLYALIVAGFYHLTSQNANSSPQTET